MATVRVGTRTNSLSPISLPPPPSLLPFPSLSLLSLFSSSSLTSPTSTTSLRPFVRLGPVQIFVLRYSGDPSQVTLPPHEPSLTTLIRISNTYTSIAPLIRPTTTSSINFSPFSAITFHVLFGLRSLDSITLHAFVIRPLFTSLRHSFIAYVKP